MAAVSLSFTAAPQGNTVTLMSEPQRWYSVANHFGADQELAEDVRGLLADLGVCS